MSDKTEISWTDATWPVVSGCTKVSPGCANCWAIRDSWRLSHNPSAKVAEVYAGTVRKSDAGELNWTGVVRPQPQRLDWPLCWKEPRRIFTCSGADLFHDAVPDDFIDRVFAVMAVSPQHRFQCLTKRPERMLAYISDPGRSRCIAHAIQSFDERTFNRAINGITDECLWGENPDITPGTHVWRISNLKHWPLSNVWLGVSAEDQAAADARVPLLLKTPAVVRFISAEPLLGSINFAEIELPAEYALSRTVPAHVNVLRRDDDDHFFNSHPALDLIIVGGESGPKARPMHPYWVRSIRDQCVARGVPFFFKQWGEYGSRHANISTGEPAPHREFPNFVTWLNKASTWVNGGTCLDTRGRILLSSADFQRAHDEHAFPVAICHRVGKKAAGRELDGQVWGQMPEAR